jgi:uncharacterized membrane protein required for colicin V production
MDSIQNFFQTNKLNIFDIITAIIFLFNIISSTKRGFVLSLTHFLKWIIAFIIAKYSIPYVLPYIGKIIKNANTHFEKCVRLNTKPLFVEEIILNKKIIAVIMSNIFNLSV